MLRIPNKGLSRSISKHNVRLDTISDWIEASILFLNDDDELSAMNVVDALIDEQIYDDQDFAWEIVQDAWAELQRRQGWIGKGSPYSFGQLIIKRTLSWKQVSGYSFCLLLALTEWYPEWAAGFGTDYTEQGELFELLTKESLEHQFPGWTIYQTGWTRSSHSQLAQVVDDVAAMLGEVKGDYELWTNPNAKEMGLDLLCFRPFMDNRVGIPVYLMQCASGRDWRGKMKTPDLDVWRYMIQFKALPRKAFSTPFAFLDEKFNQNCILVNGMLMDRCRLLAAAEHNENWLSNELSDRIITWAEPRITALPKGD